MSAHLDRIRALAPAGMNLRHIEAYMRAESGTLDRLSPDRFEAAVRVAVMGVICNRAPDETAGT